MESSGKLLSPSRIESRRIYGTVNNLKVVNDVFVELQQGKLFEMIVEGYRGRIRDHRTIIDGGKLIIEAMEAVKVVVDELVYLGHVLFF